MKNLKRTIVIFLCGVVTVPVCAQEIMYYTVSERIAQCNRDLRERLATGTSQIFGDEPLEREARPRTFVAPWKFYITKTFYKDAERILNLIGKLEAHPENEHAIEWLLKIDEIIYLQFRQFILTRRTIDQKAKNEMLTVIDQWYARPPLSNRLLTKTLLTLFHLRDCPWATHEKLSLLTLMLEREKIAFMQNIKDTGSDISRKKLEDFIDRLKDILIEEKSAWLAKKIIKYTFVTAAGVFVVFWLLPEIGKMLRETGASAMENCALSTYQKIKEDAEFWSRTRTVVVDKVKENTLGQIPLVGRFWRNGNGGKKNQ